MTTPRNGTCNPFSLTRTAIGSEEDMDRVLEEMTPRLPLPPPPWLRFQWGSRCPCCKAVVHPLPVFLLQKTAGDIWGLGVRSGGSWGGVRALSLQLPFPLRAPGAETRAAPRPGEGGARLPVCRLRTAGVTWPCAVGGLGRSRSGWPGSQPPAGAGLQVHLGAAPSSARRRRPGCAPCRRRGAGARGSPLTAAVGVDPGGRGGGG